MLQDGVFATENPSAQGGEIVQGSPSGSPFLGRNDSDDRLIEVTALFALQSCLCYPTTNTLPKPVKYFYYTLGLLLALAPNFLFAVTLKHWPPEWENREAFAKALFGVGQTQAGIDQYREAVRLNPTDDHYDELGNVLLMTGNLAEANGEFRNALALNPKNVGANGGLGFVLVLQGRTQEGIAQLLATLQLDPHDETTHWRLGTIYLQMGQKDKALEHYERVVKDHPEDPQANYYLGTTLLQLGRPADAIVQFQKALLLAPGNEMLLDSIATARAALPAESGK